MKRLIALLFTAALSALPVAAQESNPETVALQVAPAAAKESNALRLLPASPDLEEGNASVVMLRMIWEQPVWMQKVWPKLSEVADLPHDDPRVAEIPFDSFQRQLYRAAMMKHADWEYPIDSEPFATILLPDVQGLRNLAGRGMHIWIGQQITKGNLHGAREGILTQFACSRHIAQTPFLVTHLVANSISQMGLDRVELLIQQPEAPNLYWALAGLPESIGPVKDAIEFESRALMKSLPSFSDGVPATGDGKWKSAADEFVTFMNLSNPKRLTSSEADELKRKLVQESTAVLTDKLGFQDATIAKMSSEEKVMRWVMLTAHEFSTRTENAFSLPAPDAIKMLAEIDSEVQSLEQKLVVPASPFIKNTARLYMSFHGFGRRVKFLQTVEAVRDYMAQNSGKLPQSLGDCSLPIPNDPFTQKPFEYQMGNGTATLKMAEVEGVTQPQTRLYQITTAG